jgi:hypothetical protein
MHVVIPIWLPKDCIGQYQDDWNDDVGVELRLVGLYAQEDLFEPNFGRYLFNIVWSNNLILVENSLQKVIV